MSLNEKSTTTKLYFNVARTRLLGLTKVHVFRLCHAKAPKAKPLAALISANVIVVTDGEGSMTFTVASWQLPLSQSRAIELATGVTLGKRRMANWLPE